MLAKCVLVVIGAEAKEACETEQLFYGLEAGIEGGSIQCGFCGKNIPIWRNGCSSLLTLVILSIRRNTYHGCGWCVMSNPVVRG